MNQKPLTQDQILAALPTLKPDALKAVQMAAGALLTKGQADSPNQNNAQAWLFEALQATLGVHYGPRWFEGVTGRQFKQNAPQVIDFLEKHFPQAMNNRVAATALMRWLIEMISNDLKAKGVPLSTTGVVRNLIRSKAVFEQQFPDYINSGLGHLIADHIINREPYT